MWLGVYAHLPEVRLCGVLDPQVGRRVAAYIREVLDGDLVPLAGLGQNWHMTKFK